MLTGPFFDRYWMGENKDYESSNIIMLRLPFDGTDRRSCWTIDIQHDNNITKICRVQ